MRCLECSADFDEMNESQPVCPGCGASPRSEGADDADVAAVLDDAGFLQTLTADEEPRAADLCDDCLDPEPAESFHGLSDLEDALADGEALLLATGNVSFSVPGKGFRVFQLPTDRVM